MAAEYASWRQAVEVLRQEAYCAAEEEYDFAQAVKLMESVPPQHRDEVALKDWATKRDRLGTLWFYVTKHRKSAPEPEIIWRLQEVMELNPKHLPAKEWLDLFTGDQRKEAGQLARAYAAAARYDFTNAVKLMSSLPVGHQNNDLLEQWRTKSKRLNELVSELKELKIPDRSDRRAMELWSFQYNQLKLKIQNINPTYFS